MVLKNWSGEDFRQRMRRQEENAERYAREHADRLRRGQGNGSRYQQSVSLGEAFAYGMLASSALTETPSLLSQRLDEMAGTAPSFTRDLDMDGWRNGFDSIVRQLRAEIAPLL